jgi:large subunit ribosomal protein L29
MRAGEVHDLEDAELARFVGRAREEVFNLRFQHATGQLENTARIKEAKKDLARGLTVARLRGVDVEAELRKRKDG